MKSEKVVVTGVLGRLRGYGQTVYEVYGEGVEANLSSQALVKYFRERGYDVETLLFAPESLVTFLENVREIGEVVALLGDWKRLTESFYSKILFFWDDLKLYEIRVIESKGRYRYGKFDCEVAFVNSYDNIVLSILFELIRSVLYNSEGRDIVVYADISTGHNIYVAALIEALRALIVLYKLKHILEDDENSLKVYVAVSEPVFEKQRNVAVDFHEIDVKAFFSLPFSEEPKVSRILALNKENRRTIMENIVKERGFIEFRECISKLWSKLLVSFNAIVYNTPLVFYHEKIICFDEEESESLLRTLSMLGTFINLIKKMTRINVNNRSISVERIFLNGKYTINILYSAALLESIARFWLNKIKGKKPSIENIENTFIDLYKTLGFKVSARFLERDLNEFKKKDYMGDVKRNFFAHSGLLRDCISEHKEDKEIILKYKEECIEGKGISIKKWIKQPE